MPLQIVVTNRRGETEALEVPAEGTLMEVLRDREDGVAAICGGLCSCATCHVYLSPATMARLPPPENDERELTGALDYFLEGASRLACQIDLVADIELIEVTLAPEE